MGNKRLRALRNLMGISQDELAARIGISQSQVSRVERGYVIPESKDKEKIAEALEASPGELFPEA